MDTHNYQNTFVISVTKHALFWIWQPATYERIEHWCEHFCFSHCWNATSVIQWNQRTHTMQTYVISDLLKPKIAIACAQFTILWFSVWPKCNIATHMESISYSKSRRIEYYAKKSEKQINEKEKDSMRLNNHGTISGNRFFFCCRASCWLHFFFFFFVDSIENGSHNSQTKNATTISCTAWKPVVTVTVVAVAYKTNTY